MGRKLYLSHLGKIFEKRVLRGMSRFKGKEVIRCWRILYIEKLSNLCYSPNIIIIIKARRMRWEGYVAHIGNKKCIRNFSKKTKSDKVELGLYTDKLKI
jgi:hypothetical protein